MTTASRSRLFGSVVRALISYRGNPSSIPSKGMGNFSAMLYFVTTIMLEDSSISHLGDSSCFMIAHIFKDKHKVAGDINSLSLLVV